MNTINETHETGRTANRGADADADVRVLVTGSRTWTDRASLTRALDVCLDLSGDRLLVVHGGCPRGADALAAAWCRARGVRQEPTRPPRAATAARPGSAATLHGRSRHRRRPRVHPRPLRRRHPFARPTPRPAASPSPATSTPAPVTPEATHDAQCPRRIRLEVRHERRPCQQRRRGRSTPTRRSKRLAAWAIVRAHATTGDPDWTRVVNRYLASATSALDEVGALTMLVHGLALVARYEADCLAHAWHEEPVELLERRELQWLRALTPGRGP